MGKSLSTSTLTRTAREQNVNAQYDTQKQIKNLLFFWFIFIFFAIDSKFLCYCCCCCFDPLISIPIFNELNFVCFFFVRFYFHDRLIVVLDAHGMLSTSMNTHIDNFSLENIK